MTEGTLLHLQRLSTEDGPGLRTTVFFKGCPLGCAWCHNPESISRAPQVQWFAVRCLRCGTCVQVCPHGCLMLNGDGPQRDLVRCQACGECAAACPSGAMEQLGRLVDVDGLLHELLKDRAFYEKSGGGVTLSGGEPTFQPDFALALLAGLQARGISTALDTCGLTSREVLARLLPHTDLVLYDLKLLDEVRHRQFTGQPNGRILENLLFVRDFIQRQERTLGLWIRTPLIPGATDGDENLHAIGGWLAEHMQDSVARWELCAFNNLCREQYARLGLEWAYAATPLMSAAELARCADVARTAVPWPEKVRATGATRVET